MLLDRKIKSLISLCLLSAFGLGVAETYGINNNDLIVILSTGFAYAMVTGLGLYALYCFYQDCQKSRSGEAYGYLAHGFGAATIIMLCMYNYLTEGRSYYHAIGSTLLYTIFYCSVFMIVIEAVYKFLNKTENDSDE